MACGSCIVSIQVKQVRNGVIHIPRFKASEAIAGQNIISIEFYDDDRPEFREGVNVFPITGFHDPDLDVVAELVNWIEACEGENIIVHCEMGIKQSRGIAEWIVENFGYRMMRSISWVTPEGREIRATPGSNWMV